jgi:hypothetical protein
MKKFFICNACFHWTRKNEDHYIGVLGKTRCYGELKECCYVNDIEQIIYEKMERIESAYDENQIFDVQDGMVYSELQSISNTIRGKE